MWMSGPHLRSHPMSLPTRTRSDTRNSLIRATWPPYRVVVCFSFVLFFLSRASGERLKGFLDVPAVARLHQRGMRQLLLPARVIAGHRPASGIIASARIAHH